MCTHLGINSCDYSQRLVPSVGLALGYGCVMPSRGSARTTTTRDPVYEDRITTSNLHVFLWLSFQNYLLLHLFKKYRCSGDLHVSVLLENAQVLFLFKRCMKYGNVCSVCKKIEFHVKILLCFFNIQCPNLEMILIHIFCQGLSCMSRVIVMS